MSPVFLFVRAKLLNVRYWHFTGIRSATAQCLLLKRTCLFALQMSAFDPKRTSASFPANLHLASWKVVNFEQTRMPDGLNLGIGHFSSRSERRAPEPAAVGWLCYLCVCVLSPARNVELFFYSLVATSSAFLRKQLAETPNYLIFGRLLPSTHYPTKFWERRPCLIRR